MPQTLTSKLVASPWRTKFEQVISSARKELRIAAPFYNEDTVRFILTKTGKGVAKYFLLALSEQAVKTRAQSTAAIKMMQDDASCRVKFIKNLHAKFLIADQKHAVVTSSNLTSAGLDSNVEMGVLVDDLPIVEELIQRFDALWPRSQTVSKAILDEYDNLPTTPQGGKAGKSFGEVVRFGKQPKHPLAIGTVAPGWILIHSSKVYGVGNDFNSPQDELAKWYEPGRPVTWHWTLPRPLKPGGPYTLLLAYEQKIFGKAEADITRDIEKEERPRYCFAFVLRNYKRLKREIPFAELPLGSRARWHRSLIRLDDKILAAYEKLTA